ncbi:MAG: 50S ribosomal protein L3 [Calditrichaeota bacterium]|nr:MAG: 50S ribosomal protein L3 [Calditrichota bacterium]
MSAIIGKKIGMSRIFSPLGDAIPVTIIEAGPCYVTGIRTVDKNGYEAVQLGYGSAKEKKLTKSELGFFQKNELKPLRHLKEFRSFNNSSELSIGQEITADIFAEGDIVKITGFSKGKGFQGVLKRHNFHGAQQTHGQKSMLRSPGSIGQSATPARVLKGVKMPGRTGNKTVSLKNLEIVKVDSEKNILMIKGAVPGAKNGIVYIAKRVNK